VVSGVLPQIDHEITWLCTVGEQQIRRRVSRTGRAWKGFGKAWTMSPLSVTIPE